MKCNNCGGELPADAKFCILCGCKTGIEDAHPVSAGDACPYCGGRIDPTMIYCNMCGRRLTEPNLPAPLPEMKYCEVCGGVLSENEVYCSRCGSSTSGDHGTVVPFKKQRIDMGLVALIAVMIVVLCGCTGMVIGSYNSQKSVYEYSSRVVHNDGKASDSEDNGE